MHYKKLMETSSRAPSHWAASCAHKECTLHQLSPYIGKLKSVIARDLILEYSRPGELVVDMFCGSGTVPLEAARLGRRVFASDASVYATTLTRGKLFAPCNPERALYEVDRVLKRAHSLPMPDLRSVPQWVRAFFHSQTLKEILQLCDLLRNEQEYFLLASLLGILHHQRPGFLSFPSSHLVPYLRSKKYPKTVYPKLYEYRPIGPRLQAKVKRMLKRPPLDPLKESVECVRKSSVESVNLPTEIDCVITSPPYMNALDYGRDNRLRLWFLNESDLESVDRRTSLCVFVNMMRSVAEQLQEKVRRGGYCVFIIGDRLTKNGGLPSEELAKVFAIHATKFRLCRVIFDIIPDIRRSRKKLTGVRSENILVFRKY